MGYSRFDPAINARAAWNAGKIVGTKRPLTQKQIWAIRFHLDREGRLRDKALFDLAIDSKLRAAIWSRSGSVTLLRELTFAIESLSYNRRPIGRFSSSSLLMFALP